MLKILTMVAAAACAMTAVFMPAATMAHMAGGADAAVGKYLIDVGWSPETFVAGEPAALAFNLVDKDADKAADFGSVWVRISSGDKIAFAGTLRAFGRNVTFTQTFPAAGEYELAARFLDVAGETMAEQTFPLTVVAASVTEGGASPGDGAQERSFPALYALAAALVAVEIAVLSRQARKS